MVSPTQDATGLEDIGETDSSNPLLDSEPDQTEINETVIFEQVKEASVQDSKALEQASSKYFCLNLLHSLLKDGVATHM